METQRQLFDRPVNVFLGDTASPFPTAFSTKPPIRPSRTVPSPRPPETGPDRRRQPPSPMAGLKPMADETRTISPFGSPKGEGRHDQVSERSTEGSHVVRLIHPKAEPGARVQRYGRLRGRFLHRPSYDGQPRLRGGRLNGFPGVLAEVFRHHVGGSVRRVPDEARTGSFGAAKAGEPAYPRYNRGAGEGRCPFDPRQTRAPVDGAGGGVAPLPPVAARPVG